MLRLVEQSMQARARKTSVTEIAVKERKHPQAALTFDDGPDIRYTPLLLDGLKERNVRVSFFLLGEKVEQYPELVERMQKEGHLVGNHTYHHVQLNKLNETKAREEILKTNNLIYETTGVYPLYLRPPFGAWKKNLELCVEMLPVFWTIDTLDWKVQNTEKIVRTVQEQIEDGAIILMHDEYDTSVEAALQVVDELKNQGSCHRAGTKQLFGFDCFFSGISLYCKAETGISRRRRKKQRSCAYGTFFQYGQ